jgi:hypothetical protein
MTAAESYERACFDYLRLVFGVTITPLSELARIQALQRAGNAIMVAPGGGRA